MSALERHFVKCRPNPGWSAKLWTAACSNKSPLQAIFILMTLEVAANVGITYISLELWQMYVASIF